MFDNKKLNQITENLLKTFVKKQNIDFSLAQKYYPELIKVLNYHNYLYYINSAPTISDYEYDSLFTILKDIEKRFPSLVDIQSPTQRLVNQIQSEFKQQKHLQEMLSLENSYNAEDLKDRNDFLARALDKLEITKRSFVVEPKYDWLSVELIYKKWKLWAGITRWDGAVWENITKNIRTIINVPLTVKEFEKTDQISLRAEVVMPKKSFEKINSQRLLEWEALFANPRNAASGSLRQLDAAITASRWLIAYVYEILYCSSELNLKTQYDILKYLDKIWFGVNPNYKKFKTIENVVDYCLDKKVKNILEDGEVEYDWLVIKINELEIHNLIWSTNHHPRRAMAYKFPTKQISTKLLDVEFGVWRSGAITPVAILETVNVWWVKISRASMHNFDYIAQKDICIWDYVWVQRSGEVIPYILGVIKEKRADCVIDNFEYVFENGKTYYMINWEKKQVNEIISDCVIKISPPAKCPVCNTETVKIEWEVNLYCWNINCFSVIKEQLLHFVSKDCMDIEWFGDKFVELLVENNIIRNFADIYKLEIPETRLKISSLPLMGKKRVSEMLLQIQKSKNNQLRRIINWLWIKFVWKKSAKIIEKAIYDDLNIISQWNWHTLEELIKEFDYTCLDRYFTDEVFLNEIYWIWEKTVASLKFFMSKQENINILKSMQEIWVRFNNFDNQINSVENELTDKRFSITWKFDLPRPEIVEILESFGAAFDDMPTMETDFILVGTWWGSKLEKAAKYWIEIINWIEKFWERYPFVKEKFENTWNIKYQEQNLFE